MHLWTFVLVKWPIPSFLLGYNPCCACVYFTTFVEQAQYKIQSIYKDCSRSSIKFLPSFWKWTQQELFLSSSLVRLQQRFSKWLALWVYNAGWVKTAQKTMLATNTPTGRGNMPCWSFSSPSSTRLFRSILKNSRKPSKSGAYIPGVRPGKGQKSLCLVCYVV